MNERKVPRKNRNREPANDLSWFGDEDAYRAFLLVARAVPAVWRALQRYDRAKAASWRAEQRADDASTLSGEQFIAAKMRAGTAGRSASLAVDIAQATFLRLLWAHPRVRQAYEFWQIKLPIRLDHYRGGDQ